MEVTQPGISSLPKENATMAPIVVEHLKKSFGTREVLRDFSITVNSGENLVLMGRSGIGKTVLIKCIIGLIKPDGGKLFVFGKDIATLTVVQLDDMRRRIGFVFQSSALYDSMTVRQNLEFPMRHHSKNGKTEGHLQDRVTEALKSVGLQDAIDMMPSELSGGMRKRIGIARSLILNPEIVLYDEPTTGLDPITSEEITVLIKDLQQKYKTTSIIITHDPLLAKATANRLVFLIDGIAYLQGTYDELVKTTDPLVKPFFELNNTNG